MKKDNVFKITIEPLDNKSGDIDLDVCIKQLTHLENALKKTAKKISDKKTAKFKLTKASKNSPFSAEIAIEFDELENQQMLFSNVKNDLKYIKYGNIQESNLDYNVLQDYKNICKFFSKKDDRHKTSIDFGDETIVFDSELSKNINKFFSSNDNCVISYEGELEQINLHNGANYFYIYPYGQPEKIKCNFPQDLVNEAIEGIGRKVCIGGNAVYTSNQNFPHLIDIKDIEIYQSEESLPDWNDLLGIAPDATGKLLSEEFIANLRNDWI